MLKKTLLIGAFIGSFLVGGLIAFWTITPSDDPKILEDKATSVATGIASMYSGGGTSFLEAESVNPSILESVKALHASLLDRDNVEVNITEMYTERVEQKSDISSPEGGENLDNETLPYDSGAEEPIQTEGIKAYDTRLKEHDGAYFMGINDFSFTVDNADYVQYEGTYLIVPKESVPVSYTRMIEDVAYRFSLTSVKSFESSGKSYIDVVFTSLKDNKNLLVRFTLLDGDLAIVEVTE